MSEPYYYERKLLVSENGRVLTRSTSRGIRRITVCVLGTVLSCYIFLFIVVVSRHLDASSEQELRNGLSSDQGMRLNRPAGMMLMGHQIPGSPPKNENQVAQQPSKVMANREAILNYLGLKKFDVKDSLVAKLLDENGRALVARRKAFRVCLQPRFREPPGPVVALASFPGSGNTWLRYLVQQTTGYLTGSVYRDFALLRYGFPAESVMNGSVALVKTHEWGPAARKPFQGAVLLVRDPYGALLAEFNRRAGGHLGHAAPEKFRRGKIWKDYVTVQIRYWTETILDWLKFEGPLHVVRYEDMVRDLHRELRRLMRFLNITVPWPAYSCVLKNKDGIFRRSKLSSLKFEPFDPEMRSIFDKSIKLVDKAIAFHKSGMRTKLMNLTADAVDSL